MTIFFQNRFKKIANNRISGLTHFALPTSIQGRANADAGGTNRAFVLESDIRKTQNDGLKSRLGQKKNKKVLQKVLHGLKKKGNESETRSPSAFRFGIFPLSGERGI